MARLEAECNLADGPCLAFRVVVSDYAGKLSVADPTCQRIVTENGVLTEVADLHGSAFLAGKGTRSICCGLSHSGCASGVSCFQGPAQRPNGLV